MSDFPEIAPARLSWMVTLADLALLLVGFLLLVQATAHDDRPALVASLRQGFGAAPLPAAPPPAMPVAASATGEFAPGSAELRGDRTAILAWARDAVRDPRVTLAITGAADGSPRDVDPATRSPAVLAADRARAVAALLAQAVPAARMTIATTIAPGRRAATVTLGFAGEGR